MKRLSCFDGFVGFKLVRDTECVCLSIIRHSTPRSDSHVMSSYTIHTLHSKPVVRILKLIINNFFRVLFSTTSSVVFLEARFFTAVQIYEFNISKIIIHQIQFITLIGHLILVINLQGIVQRLKGRIDNQILEVEGLRNTHAHVGQCYNEGDNRLKKLW